MDSFKRAAAVGSATGMSARAQPLWRAEMSRGGRTAPSVRRSSSAPRLFLRQTDIRFSDAVSGHLRAVRAQGALDEPSFHGESKERKYHPRSARVTRLPRSGYLRLYALSGTSRDCYSVSQIGTRGSSDCEASKKSSDMPCARCSRDLDMPNCLSDGQDPKLLPALTNGESERPYQWLWTHT